MADVSYIAYFTVDHQQIVPRHKLRLQQTLYKLQIMGGITREKITSNAHVGYTLTRDFLFIDQ